MTVTAPQPKIEAESVVPHPKTEAPPPPAVVPQEVHGPPAGHAAAPQAPPATVHAPAEAGAHGHPAAGPVHPPIAARPLPIRPPLAGLGRGSPVTPPIGQRPAGNRSSATASSDWCSGYTEAPRPSGSAFCGACDASASGGRSAGDARRTAASPGSASAFRGARCSWGTGDACGAACSAAACRQARSTHYASRPCCGGFQRASFSACANCAGGPRETRSAAFAGDSSPCSTPPRPNSVRSKIADSSGRARA